MPIQEGLVLDGNYGVPCGVLFARNYTSRTADIAAWKEALPAVREEAERGRVIGILAQSRNTRAWSDEARNFEFDVREDYLVAVYSLSRSFCSPFEPGSLANGWYDETLRTELDLQHNSFLSDEKPFPLFYCDEAGCALSRNGILRVVKAFRDRAGLPEVEALTAAKANMAKVEYGWRGNFFDPDDEAAAAADQGDPFAGFDTAF